MKRRCENVTVQVAKTWGSAWILPERGIVSAHVDFALCYRAYLTSLNYPACSSYMEVSKVYERITG